MKRLLKLLCLMLAMSIFIHSSMLQVFAEEEVVDPVPAAVEPTPEEAEAAPEEAEAAPEEAEAAPEEVLTEEPVEQNPEQAEAPGEDTEPEDDQAATEEPAPEETVPEQEEEEGGIRHDIPLYFQNDYPDTMYGYGTVESSGCSITCLAMVATYLTGETYLPDQLARYFGGRAANNMARMEYGSDMMQLPYEKNTNWHTTLAALKEGKIAIALMNENSVFTDSQHFVVLTGITADGKILVNDPYLPNYGKMELAFVDGFNQLTISNGYSGGWVYDPAAMPEEPFLYYEELPQVEKRFPDIHLNQEDRQLLARVVWVEARGESFEGQQAVAEVVLNRMASGKFSDSLRGVIYAEGQFRSVDFLDEAEPYQTQYEAVDRALNGPYVLPEDVYFFATYPTNDKMWGKIGGHIFCYGE